jgi:IS4 transposase
MPIPGQGPSQEHFRIGHNLLPCCTTSAAVAIASEIWFLDLTKRRAHYRDPETGKEYVFLTNRFDLSALAIADLYRQRWQIELFFKRVKQNMKIKTFYGTSRNAVLIQIWTA